MGVEDEDFIGNPHSNIQYVDEDEIDIEENPDNVGDYIFDEEDLTSSPDDLDDDYDGSGYHGGSFRSLDFISSEYDPEWDDFLSDEEDDSDDAFVVGSSGVFMLAEPNFFTRARSAAAAAAAAAGTNVNSTPQADVEVATTSTQVTIPDGPDDKNGNAGNVEESDGKTSVVQS